MILGEDIGNFAVKTSRDISFPSKCSKVGNILNSSPVVTDEGPLYIGEGTYDTEYRKVKKANIRMLFLYGIALSSNDTMNRVVVGLPLSQYKQDKDELRELLLSQRINTIGINGSVRKVCIEDVAVYPEGVAAIIGTDFEGIIVDIGGRTTDVCQVTDLDGLKKVNNPYSIAKGTMNLYSDFTKAINAKYGLDLHPDDTDRILRKGLTVNGESLDCSFAADIFKQYVEELVNAIQVEYSLKTQDVMLIGGGCQLLEKSLKRRIPQARVIDNPIFANARGFKKAGERLWI